jgi:hypothetical protein
MSTRKEKTWSASTDTVSELIEEGGEMRRLGAGSNAVRLSVAGLLTLAACSTDAAQTATTTTTSATSATSTTSTTSPPPTSTTSSTSPITTTTVDPFSDREAYIAAAILTAPQDATDFDASCLAEGVVDAVGFDTLVGLEVLPDALFEADDFLQLGIEDSAGLRADLTDTFQLCTNLDQLAAESVASLGIELASVTVDCMIVEFADLIAELQVAVSIDADTDFGDKLAVDGTVIGARCGILALETAEGADVMWDTGQDLYVDALASQLAASSYDAVTIGLSDEQATCFASGIPPIIGVDVLSSTALTAGDLGLYLRQATPFDSLPFEITPDHAEGLALLYEGCVDVAALAAAKAALALENLGLDSELVGAYNECFIDNSDPASAYDSLVLGFLYGAASFDDPEFRKGVSEGLQIGEVCGAAVFG